jgi:DNA-binding MarR family transcriptional regulator
MSDESTDDTARALAAAVDIRALVAKLRRRLAEESAPGEFTPSQTAVVRRLLTEGQSTLTALARAEGIRSQSMGTLVSSLEAAGFVRGEPHPTDGRQTILSLTDAAHETILAGRAAKEGWLFRTIRSTLNGAEQEQLVAAIALLNRLVDS